MSGNEKTESEDLLNTSEVNRLKAEERLRLEIRNALEPKKQKRFLWEFLNSAFGLFLLSAILVSGLGKWLSKKYEEEKANTAIEKAAKLHIIELDYRLSRIMYFIDRDEPDSTELLRNQTYAWRIIVGDSLYKPAIPQFKSWHILGLISWFELNLKLKDLKLYNEAYMRARTMENIKSREDLFDKEQIIESVRKIREFRNGVREVLNSN